MSVSLLKDNKYLPYVKGKIKCMSKNMENTKCFMSAHQQNNPCIDRHAQTCIVPTERYLVIQI